MYHPTLDQLLEVGELGNVVPVWLELPADLETPVSVYLKLRGEGPSFLLESVEKGEQVGRYSFLGIEPSGIITAQDGRVTVSGQDLHGGFDEAQGDLLAVARGILSEYDPVSADELPRFFGGLVGYLAYDAVRFFERVPLPRGTGLGLPDAVFLLANILVIFDHVKHRLLVVVNAPLDGDPRVAYETATRKIDEIVSRLHQPLATAPPSAAGRIVAPTQWVSNLAQSDFETAVRQAKEYIECGDIFQVVLSQRLSRRTSAEPLSIYRALRMLNPSPYMFFLELPEGLSLIGSSPEMLVRLDKGLAEVRPIAGTRTRGTTPDEDDALARELMADPKERAEHVMLVDLGRNDLGRVCQYGTVSVPDMMFIERYSHVMHIVSNVQGRIRPDQDSLDLLRATFPAGTVSGAPKIRAMEIIAELEGSRRGPYSGAVGYLGYSGNMDTCIAIRSIIMQGDTVHMQAGAGIVADSDPTREYHETLSKAQALMEAVEIAERMF